jgi:hypothetical protein
VRHDDEGMNGRIGRELTPPLTHLSYRQPAVNFASQTRVRCLVPVCSEPTPTVAKATAPWGWIERGTRKDDKWNAGRP